MMKLQYVYQEIGKNLHQRAGDNILTITEKEEIEEEILKVQQSFLTELERNLSLLIEEISASIGTREMGDMS